MLKNISTCKKIKVLSRGRYETTGGYITGPILVPYLETQRNIYLMLLRGNADIVEVLPNGKTVKLTLDNYNTNNTSVEPKAPVKAPEVVNTEKLVENKKIENPIVKEPVVEKTIDETVDSEKVEPVVNENNVDNNVTEVPTETVEPEKVEIPEDEIKDNVNNFRRKNRK